MKKKLNVIAIVLLALVLGACGFSTKQQYTITFEENGGSEVENITLALDEINTFTLPNNPTKEGYQFGGWYIDSMCENEFETLPVGTNNITLYAKWNRVKSNGDVIEEVKGVKTTGSFKIKYDEVALTSSLEANQFEYNVSFEVVTPQEQVTSLEEIVFGLKLDVEGSRVEVVDGVAIPYSNKLSYEVICYENIVYLSLPAELLYPGIPAFSPICISINLETILAELENTVTVPDVPADDEEMLDVQNFISGLLEEISNSKSEDIVSVIIAYAKESGEFEFTDEEWSDFEVTLNELIALLAQIKPTETVEGNKTTYTVTDEDIQTWTSAIYDFIDKNYDVFVKDNESDTKNEDMQMISGYVTMINNAIDLRKCELSLTNAENGDLSKIEFDFNLQGISENVFVIEMDVEVNFNYQTVELTHPNQENYTDMTAMFIQYMNMEGDIIK